MHEATPARYSALPGYDLVERGLAELRRGEPGEAGLLVLIGAPRLRTVGVGVPVSSEPAPEHRLYELLARTDPDSAHGRYNALIRRLVSFERAAAACGG